MFLPTFICLSVCLLDYSKTTGAIFSGLKPGFFPPCQICFLVVVYGVVCYTVVRRGHCKTENELALYRAEMRMIRWMRCEIKGLTILRWITAANRNRTHSKNGPKK